MTAKERIQRARTDLILNEGQAFWGSLALRLKPVECEEIPTAATDGRQLLYNPAFVDSLSQAELLGVIAHEVAHCALGHLWRLPFSNPKLRVRANVAADLAENLLLVNSGFYLPEGALHDEKWEGKSAEYIFQRLEKDQEQPGGTGMDCMPPGEGEDGEGQQGSLKQQWEQAVREAAEAAHRRGQLPAGLERFVDAASKPRTDPLGEILRFLSHRAKDDFTLRYAHRHYAPHGMVVPTLYSERMGPIVVGVDTSGSIDSVLLGKFAAWCQAILDDFKPETMHVLYADAGVAGTEAFEPGDLIQFKPKGGGGTSFVPVFEIARELEPEALIYLTDLYGEFPPAAPDYPVCWVTPTEDVKVPFGEVVSCRE